MKQRFLAWPFLFAATAVFAQSSQPAEPPMETASPLAIWAFAIIFFGICGVYGWMTWRNSKKGEDK